MQLFVDVLSARGAELHYRESRGASWVHPAMPIAVLTAGLFGATDSALYHVEGGRFVTAETIADTPVRDIDTLVVVSGVADPEVIDRAWQRSGGPTRRLAAAGMPATQRRALAAYAS